MNAMAQLSPVERIRVSVVRAQAALELGDRTELRRFLDEMRRLDGAMQESVPPETTIQAPAPQPGTETGPTKAKRKQPDTRRRTAPEVLDYIRERDAAGVSATQIAREMIPIFGAGAITQSSVSRYLRMWRATGEIPELRPRKRKGAAAPQPADPTRASDEAAPEPRLITAARLADIMNLSDGALAQTANFGNWPRQDGQFIVDRLPEGVRRKVAATITKEAP